MEYLDLKQKNGPVMVIMPHQDDEVLLTAGILYQAKQLGRDVEVVIVTNGDCGCSDYTKGQERLRETEKGMRLLGVEAQDLIFLGYADTGMPKEESFLWKLYQENDPAKVYRSGCSDRTYALTEKEEYHMERYKKHAPYTRDMVKQDLRSLLLQYKPDHIFTTTGEDVHGDHAGLYLFIQEILREVCQKENYNPEVFCGLVHSAAGDDLWPERKGESFTCPEGFDSGKWEERYCFMLPEEMRAERGSDNLKYRALLQYKTALEPSAYIFLMSFIKDEEIFWKMKM